MFITSSSMLCGELKFCETLNAGGVDVDDDAAKLKYEIITMKKYEIIVMKKI